jgi:hypothetical protein
MGVIPRFTIYYANRPPVDGGGEDDEIVYVAFSKKWLEAPADGVTHVVSEVSNVGRYFHSGQEFYYQLPLDSHGKGEIGSSMKIGPFLRQAVDNGSIVKFGGWTSVNVFQSNAAAAAKSAHVPQQSGTVRTNDEDASD